MFSMKSVPQIILAGGGLFLGSQNPSSIQTLGTSQTCPVDSPLSCQRNTGFADGCCLNNPGGQIAQTQFWNSNASKGPPGYLGPHSSWTIHGLWPDHCDGTFDSVCDCSRSGDCSSFNRKCSRNFCNRDYSSVNNILKKFGQDELISYMETYWKGIAGDEHLHQHEWSKHGTCVSTLSPSCYADYQAAQEVVDYFKTAVNLFDTLPTYDWLGEAGIYPRNSAPYDLKDIQDALKTKRGVSAVVGCQGSELREVWYHFNVRGSLQAGEFVASEPNFSGSRGPGKYCPRKVWYRVKDE